MKAGDAFLPKMLQTHLWVILSDPDLDGEKVVLVNLTTYTIDEESHCVLQKGDHPFVKHETAVRFAEARMTSVAKLTALLKSSQLAAQKPLSSSILDGIRQAAALSDRLPAECRTVLDEQGLI